MFHNKYYHYIHNLLFFLLISIISWLILICPFFTHLNHWLRCDVIATYFCVMTKLHFGLMIFYWINLFSLIWLSYRFFHFYFWKWGLFLICLYLSSYLPIIVLQIFYYLSLFGAFCFNLLNAILLIDGVIYFHELLTPQQSKLAGILACLITSLLIGFDLFFNQSYLNMILHVGNLCLSIIIGYWKNNLSGGLTLICYNSYLICSTLELNNKLKSPTKFWTLTDNLINLLLVIWSILSISNSHNLLTLNVNEWHHSSERNDYHAPNQQDNIINELDPDIQLSLYFEKKIRQLKIFLLVLICATYYVNANYYDSTLIPVDFRLWFRLSSIVINIIIFGGRGGAPPPPLTRGSIPSPFNPLPVI